MVKMCRLGFFLSLLVNLVWARGGGPGPGVKEFCANNPETLYCVQGKQEFPGKQCGINPDSVTSASGGFTAQEEDQIVKWINEERAKLAKSKPVGDMIQIVRSEKQFNIIACFFFFRNGESITLEWLKL